MERQIQVQTNLSALDFRSFPLVFVTPFFFFSCLLEATREQKEWLVVTLIFKGTSLMTGQISTFTLNNEWMMKIVAIGFFNFFPIRLGLNFDKEKVKKKKVIGSIDQKSRMLHRWPQSTNYF